MLGLNELALVAIMIGTLYLLTHPPGWLTDRKKQKFLSELGGIDKDRISLRHVRRIGREVIERNSLTDLGIQVFILRSNIPNAYAWSNGEIYLTRGILELARDDAEIASTLAHEIGHVAARHHAKQAQRAAKLTILSSALPGGLFGKAAVFLLRGNVSAYSQEQELEADALSVQYLHKSGYNPMATYSHLIRTYEVLGTDEERNPLHEFLSSHPVSAVRLEKAFSLAKQCHVRPA